MIALWKGKNPIYFGVIGSKVKVTYSKYNFWQQGRFRMITFVLYIGSLPNLTTWLPCGRERTLFILGSLGQRSRSLTINIIFDKSFPHDNFSSVYWIFTKLNHMIPPWKGKNPIYFGVIRSKFKVTYYKYNFWQQGRFRTVTLVLYIGYLINLATWFPCGRGRTLFILGSLPLYRLIIYIDSMPRL